jgi:predicted nucleic acid-binding protein
MGQAQLKAVFDSDVLLDFLDGFSLAASELMRYRERCLSIVSWMEVMVGARNKAAEEMRRNFLKHFDLLPLTSSVAEEAVALRREHRLKLPDAIIWATALTENCLLVTRNTRHFPEKQPGIRFPYCR